MKVIIFVYLIVHSKDFIRDVCDNESYNLLISIVIKIEIYIL